MKDKTRRQILSVLSRHAQGLTIIEIAEKVGITRQTASKYLQALRGEDTVEVREVGPAKLHYLDSHTAEVTAG